MNISFDEDRIRRLTSHLLGASTALRRLGSFSKEDFLAELDRVASAKYHFIIAIEAMIDLCNHVIAKNKLRAPEDYADTFRVMHEAGAFPKDFADVLMKMARFRNRLVHLYWEVDDHEVYRILQENLGDLERFLKEFGRFIGRQEEKTQT